MEYWICIACPPYMAEFSKKYSLFGFYVAPNLQMAHV